MSKAVERLPSRKRSMRAATLAWLETAARTREPEYLQLSSHTELLPILKAAQDSQSPEVGLHMSQFISEGRDSNTDSCLCRAGGTGCKND